jgi:hypothetical protein
LGVEKVKGSENHENGNFERIWVLENLHMQMLVIPFFVNLVLGFICFLSKFPILGTFQNLGLKKDFYSFIFVKALCGALSHNYVAREFVVLWA